MSCGKWILSYKQSVRGLAFFLPPPVSVVVSYVKVNWATDFSAQVTGARNTLVEIANLFQIHSFIYILHNYSGFIVKKQKVFVLFVLFTPPILWYPIGSYSLVPSLQLPYGLGRDEGR